MFNRKQVLRTIRESVVATIEEIAADTGFSADRIQACLIDCEDAGRVINMDGAWELTMQGELELS